MIVKRGEIFGILGPNGAGKTTTLNMITADLNPDKGKVEFKSFFFSFTQTPAKVFVSKFDLILDLNLWSFILCKKFGKSSTIFWLSLLHQRNSFRNIRANACRSEISVYSTVSLWNQCFRTVFITLSNIWDGPFLKNSQRLKTFICFTKSCIIDVSNPCWNS